MRTRTSLIIGFTTLFLIFTITSIIQWENQNEIKLVSEYHNFMSVPAISILNDVNLNYNIMHSEAQQILLGKQSLEDLNDASAGFVSALQQYDELTYATNSAGNTLAPSMMIQMMENFIEQSYENHDSYEKIFSQYQNNIISQIETASLLAETKSEFDMIINDVITMEQSGIMSEQDTIKVLEYNIQMTYFISSIIVVIVTSLIIFQISRFVTNPLSSLIKITSEIASGDFTKKEISTKNSDVNDVKNAINIMSENLEQYKSALMKQEKLSSIGVLSSRLAHDIRNPLAVIKGTIDIMQETKKDQLTQDELEKFGRMERAIQRISHQIYNVLDFIQGKPLELSSNSLHEILDSTIADISRSEKIKIDTIGSDVNVDCDFEGLKIVLINLITNAIQAIGKEGVVKINVIDQANFVSIEVEDTGSGISEDNIERIFDPLFTTKQEGTGLGLASCKSIIEQHKGTISVKNNPTTFTIRLPKTRNQKETILKFEK